MKKRQTDVNGIHELLVQVRDQSKVTTYGYLAEKYGSGEEKSSPAVAQILKHEPDLKDLCPFVVGHHEGDFFITSEGDEYETQYRALESHGIFPMPVSTSESAMAYLKHRLGREINPNERRIIDASCIWGPSLEYFKNKAA